MSFLFVYGTLRNCFEHEVNTRVGSLLQYRGMGQFSGRLFEVQGYPAAIQTTDNAYPIVGELYELIDEKQALQILDDYEECSPSNPEPHEYIRKQILIQPEGFEKTLAWVYLYNYPIKGLEEIISGDYREYRK